MHRDKAARYRSKERKEGIIMLDRLWKTKTKLVFRATAASKTFSTGTISGQFSGNQTASHLRPKKQSLHRKYNKASFIFWPGKNLTPHHYWGFTAPCALSSVGKTEKSSKPVHQETTPLACAQVQHQLFMHLSVQDGAAGNYCPFTTFTHTQPGACNAPANARENTKIDGKTERQNTDCVQAGRAVNPATSAYKTQRKSTKTHLNTHLLWNNTEPYKTSLAEGQITFLTSLKHTCCQDSFLEIL